MEKIENDSVGAGAQVAFPAGAGDTRVVGVDKNGGLFVVSKNGEGFYEKSDSWVPFALDNWNRIGANNAAIGTAVGALAFDVYPTAQGAPTTLVTYSDRREVAVPGHGTYTLTGGDSLTFSNGNTVVEIDFANGTRRIDDTTNGTSALFRPGSGGYIALADGRQVMIAAGDRLTVVEGGSFVVTHPNGDSIQVARNFDQSTAASQQATETSGHWEDRTAYDLMTGLDMNPTTEMPATAPTAAPQQDDALGLLALFLRLNGRPADLGQLRHRFGRHGEALDLGGCVRALEALGFAARVESGGVAALRKAAGPVITRARDGRWLMAAPAPQRAFVVQAATQDQPERLSEPAFEALGCSQWIVARPAQTAAEEARAQTADAPPKAAFGLGWFWASLKKYRSLMGEVLLASFFVQVFALLSPLIFQVVIDKVLTHRSMSTLDVMVIALLGVSLFEIVLGALRHYLFSHTTNRLDVELGAKLFEHLLQLPMSYFESRRGGDTVARVRELDNARSFLTGQALTSWLDLAFAGVFIAVMFYYSATLTFIVLAALPVFFAASWIVTPLLRKKLEDKFALGAENQAFLVETVASMETLKSQAAEPHWQREWERRLAEQVRAGFHAGHLSHATQQFISLASKLLTAVLLWFGAKLVIDGELTVGGLIAFNMLSGRVNAPILKLASLWQEFTQMKVSVKRLADIMDASPEATLQPGRSLPPDLHGHVLLDNVSFSYSDKAPPVLSDVSLEAQPGEIIGVVGVSGAGKTTLMRLIQRLHAPERGRVLVDGVDLSLVDAGWLRRQLGVVGQDAMLFNRSVRENIALGAPGLEIEAIWQAAQLAGAHDFILQLPEGYDTVIGERGSRLSGGQRARIAIARALVHNPRLLLLDEATAALDYESERLIHDHMAQIAAGRTVFIVAHRLSTMRVTDRIVVLEKGRVVQTGTHAELMNQVGRYRALYHAHLVMEGPPADRPGAFATAGAAHV